MKILISFKKEILAFGEFVFPENKTQEVVELSDLTVSNILDICEIEEIEIKSKKKNDIISEINDYLNNNFTEVNEMSDEQKYEDIVVAGFEAEKSDNDMKKELFEAGCDFGDINKTFNSIITEKALRMSPKDRNTKASEFLEGYVPGTVEEHLAKVAELEDFLGCKTTQAGASMRAWAKANDVELPKAPAVSSVDPGFRGNQKIVADHALANKGITFADLVIFAEANVEKTKGGKDNSRGYAVSIWNSIVFAKSWSGEDVEEATEEVTEEAA